MAQTKKLRSLASSKVTIFKIKNRKGYAAIALSNLTEGRSPAEAYERMAKAVKRAGFALTGKVPAAR